MQTGIYTGQQNHPVHPADLLCRDVQEAVDRIIEIELKREQEQG